MKSEKLDRLERLERLEQWLDGIGPQAAPVFREMRGAFRVILSELRDMQEDLEKLKKESSCERNI